MMKPKVPPSSEETTVIDEAPRKRDREQTSKDLNLALERLQQEGRKITLKAVADEAGVSPSLINNRYPDFAEKVRGIIGKTVRQQRNEKADLLTKEREKCRELREQVSSLLKEITLLASINETLRAELVLQKAVASGRVVKGEFSRKAVENAPIDED